MFIQRGETMYKPIRKELVKQMAELVKTMPYYIAVEKTGGCAILQCCTHFINIMLYCEILCSTTLYCIILSILYHTVPYCAILCYTVLHCTTLYILYFIVVYRTIFYYTRLLPYGVAQNSTLFYSIVQYI